MTRKPRDEDDDDGATGLRSVDELIAAAEALESGNAPGLEPERAFSRETPGAYRIPLDRLVPPSAPPAAVPPPGRGIADRIDLGRFVAMPEERYELYERRARALERIAAAVEAAVERMAPPQASANGGGGGGAAIGWVPPGVGHNFENLRCTRCGLSVQQVREQGLCTPGPQDVP